MKTKDILDAWSTNKDRLFMYQRFQSDTPKPCVVVGFHTVPAVTTGLYRDRKPAQRFVDILYYGYHDEGEAMRVSARNLELSYHETLAEYREVKRRRDESDAHRLEVYRKLVADFEEVAKALCLGVRLTEEWNGGRMVPRVVGSVEDYTALLGTLRDAKRYYDTLATEEAV